MSCDDDAGRGAERVVQALEALGVQIVFGLPGVHNLAIWRALAGSSIRLIGVRHEQTAGYAADGYARATGRLGVALVTTGPGAANTLAATGEALASGSPVLVIATDIPSGLRRPGVYRGVLHETRDQAAMFAPVTRVATRVDDADAIGAAVLAAGARALTAPSGPVYLGIPTDLLTAPAAPVPAVPVGTAVTRRTGVASVAGTTNGAGLVAVAGIASDGALLAEACRRLSAARQPLIWAGGGALRAGAGEMIGALAQALAAPVITTYGSRGLLAPGHPCAVPGPVHHPAVGVLWDRADLVLAIGTDFDGMMTQNWAMPAPSELIAVNVDAADAAKNYPADIVLVGDAAAVSGELAGLVSPRAGLPTLTAELAAIGADVSASVAADEPQAAGSARRCRARGRHVHPRVLAGGLLAGARAPAVRLSGRVGDARLRLPSLAGDGRGRHRTGGLHYR
jgi:thiamine pyrophosphate-dependent acetolactate synthase large subunit-like protein